MKRLLIATLLAGVMLIAGCGKKAEESGGLFETLSTEEVDSATQSSMQQTEGVLGEAVMGSKPIGKGSSGEKKRVVDKEKPEETAPAASPTQEALPETAPSPKPEKTPAAGKTTKEQNTGKTPTAKPEKTAEPEKTAKPVKTAEPVKTTEPSQAPASAPEPVKEPEQTPIPAHTHAYVEETTAATCTDAAVITTKCSSCGEVSGTRTEGGALGHDWEKVVHFAPTCSMKGYGYSRCKRCGQQQDHGNIDKLPHDYEVTVVVEGDCQNPKVTERVCRTCNTHEPREYDWDAHKDDHVWITETFKEYDATQHKEVDVTRTCCSRCGKDKE